jgi:hypothetical protein
VRRRATAWLGTLTTVALLAGCATAGAQRQAISPSPCDSLDASYTAVIHDTAGRQLDPGYLRVPVVIHLMTDPDDPPAKQPEQYWTPDFVRTYLGIGNLSVNTVWRQASIRFDVVHVERCHYAPPAGTFRTLTSGAKAMFPPDTMTLRDLLPAAQQDVVDHYLGLNVRYGVPRTLNLYLWRNMGDANGYGESPRRNRREVAERGLQALSTVWYESGEACGPLAGGGDDCQVPLAHEFGHALALTHSCSPCGPQPDGRTCCTDLCFMAPDHFFTCQASQPSSQRWNNWCACEILPDANPRPTACGDAYECCGPRHATEHRLMFPKAGGGPGAGSELCRGEIESARSGAREFF